jgi:hypothetical protein
MPAGLLVTVPVPFPAGLTLSTGNRLKVATTCRSADMFRVHVCVPEQAWLHPTNMEPGSGVAFRVTEVPLE